MGNDDALADKETLQYIADQLSKADPVAVAITNYYEIPSRETFRRIRESAVLEGNPDVVAQTFRDYAFVSGIVLEGEGARAAHSTSCDGSEMYQIYLGAKLIGAGGKFLGLDRVCVHKDIQLPGQTVDSYRAKARIWPCKIEPRHLPMGRLLQTVAAGLDSNIDNQVRKRALFSAARQLYVYTYPYWIFEYRSVQSFNYALGVYLALRPSVTTKATGLGGARLLTLWMIYLSAGIVGFTLPVTWFNSVRSHLYSFAKRSRPKLAAARR